MEDIFKAKIAAAPLTPGVYLMRNKDGHVIYVGKSISIRKRLLQHAASLKAGWSDRNHRWIYHVADVEWHETGSELYALLLEDQLIKKYWPLANVRQKDFLEYAYLAFTLETIPRLTVINAREREHYRHVFGPFRNIYYAQDMADLVQSRYRLRTCATVIAGGCLQWEIRKCVGPCRSPNAATRYFYSIEQAIASLRSFDVLFVHFIENRIKVFSQKCEFEKAAHHHGMLHRYQGFIKRQRFLEMFRLHGCLIRETGRWPNRFLFFQGRLVERNGSIAGDYDNPQSEWQIVDRANVIYQWQASQRSECELAIIDARLFRE